MKARETTSAGAARVGLSRLRRHVADDPRRLPADLRGAPSGPDFRTLPFTSLYLTGEEWAAEVANRTVHGAMHLRWYRTSGYRGQMAVLVGDGHRVAAYRLLRHNRNAPIAGPPCACMRSSTSESQRAGCSRSASKR